MKVGDKVVANETYFDNIGCPDDCSSVVMPYDCSGVVMTIVEISNSIVFPIKTDFLGFTFYASELDLVD